MVMCRIIGSADIIRGFETMRVWILYALLVFHLQTAAINGELLQCMCTLTHTVKYSIVN